MIKLKLLLALTLGGLIQAPIRAASPPTPLAPLPAPVLVNQVSIKVEENTASTPGNKDRNKEPKETSLKISIGNLTREDLGTLQVRYFLFTKEAKGNNPTLGKAGARRVTLPQGGSDKCESKNISYEFHPQHTDVGQDGKTHNTPAGGQKYGGYVVQVFKGDAMIGQKMSPELLGKVDPATLQLKE